MLARLRLLGLEGALGSLDELFPILDVFRASQQAVEAKANKQEQSPATGDSIELFLETSRDLGDQDESRQVIHMGR